MFERTCDLIENLYKDNIVPGVSYAVIKPGEVLTKVIGNSQVIPKVEKLKAGMLYDMASLTKVVGTTTVILKLVEDNKISIDDKVMDYLPLFKDDRVTIRHLLTHTSALNGYIPHRNELNAQELIKAMYTLKVGDWLGKKVIYTDTGLILLGEIIQKIYNKPVQTVITQEVLQPLQLFESTFNPDPRLCVPTEVQKNGKVLKGIVHDPKARILGKYCGSAGLFMSLNDLIKFSNWIIHNSKNRVLKDKTISKLFNDWTPNGTLGRSLGWDLRYRNDGVPCIYHTGYTGTFILIDRDSGCGLIVLSNRVHPSSNNQIFLDRRDIIISTFLDEIIN